MNEHARVGHASHRRWAGRVVVAALALALGAACAGTDDRGSVDTLGDSTPGTPEPTPGPDPEPEADPTPPSGSAPREEVPEAPAPAPDPAPAPAACDPDRDGTIGAAVSTQLDAFAASDVTGAYAMTSPFFRRVLDADAFETLIRTEYPELLGNDGHRLGECLVRGRRGSLIVGVRAGTQEVVLRYDLSEEPDGWRIDGARRLPDGTLPPRPLA